MKTHNAIEIIKKRLEKNPSLQNAYQKEKERYQIACKIREHRKAAGLTQQELARKVGTKQSVISRIENLEYESHSLSLLKKIASALDIPIEGLIEKVENNPRIISFPMPEIMKKAASFSNTTEDQIIVNKSYAR